MRNLKKLFVFVAFTLAIFLITISASETKEIQKTFKAKEILKISAISGDFTVEKGKADEIKIHVVNAPDNKYFEPVFEEEDNTLVLREKFPGFSSSEECRWEIWVPEKTKIQFSSASGKFSVKGLQSDISANIASGDIYAVGCKGRLNAVSASGRIELSDLTGEITAKAISGDVEVKDNSGDITIKAVSGDIEVKNLEGNLVLKGVSGDIDVIGAKGSFKVSCASGDIQASDILIKGDSSFKVASGDILVVLGGEVPFDLSLNSATGNAVLNYNGNPVKGLFEFSARADIGKIVSPFKFDKEEEIYKHGKKYFIKSFKKGADTPKITISTAIGKAVLEK